MTQEVFFTESIALTILKKKKKKKRRFEDKFPAQILLCFAGLMSCYLSDLLKSSSYTDGFKFFLDLQLIV